MTVSLPLPLRALSPNSRAHWAKKATSVKRARTLAFIMTKAQPKEAGPWNRYRITFHWATARRMDDDNAISCCKSYMDGICSALGIDDRELRLAGLDHAKDKESPRVVVEVWGE